MGQLWITFVLGCAVFVPLLIISIVRFKSPAIAFAVSATFSIGAMIGFASLKAGNCDSVDSQAAKIPHDSDMESLILTFVFASAGAIAGAATALTLLRKIAGDKPWRRR